MRAGADADGIERLAVATRRRAILSEVKPNAVVHVSLQAAGQADRAYYASLTATERLAIQFELIARYRESLGEAAERLERVHRIVELKGS